jgi:N utilization substance protein B
MSKNINQKRSLSRLMAVQIFYQYDFFKREKNIQTIQQEVIKNYLLKEEDNLETYEQNIDQDFLNNLCFGLEKIIDEIDIEISPMLKDGWNLEKINEIILQIIRLAVFELKFINSVPIKVVIDEYVDITGSFFEPKQTTFANGIIENLAKKIRNLEFQKIK